MSTLAIKKNNIIYLCISIFCGIFSYVYEQFSHEVYSPYMMYPGVVTLIAGIFITSLIGKGHTKWSYRFYNSSVACFIIGMYIKGILDIYGTTNEYVEIYFLASLIFLGLTILVMIKKFFTKKA